MRRTAFKHALVLMASMHLGILSQSVLAQSQCAATNDNDDQMCSVSCPLGQAATCNAGVGSSTPKCACSGTAASVDPGANGYRETSASTTNGN